MTKAERGEKLPYEPFTELEVGDSLFDQTLLDWKFVLSVPEDVAHWWIAHHFSNSAISREGLTPDDSPMKTWETGVGIVVETPTSIPGEERLCLLHKTGGDDFRIYVSKETRDTSRGSND